MERVLLKHLCKRRRVGTRSALQPLAHSSQAHRRHKTLEWFPWRSQRHLLHMPRSHKKWTGCSSLAFLHLQPRLSLRRFTQAVVTYFTQLQAGRPYLCSSVLQRVPVRTLLFLMMAATSALVGRPLPWVHELHSHPRLGRHWCVERWGCVV